MWTTSLRKIVDKKVAKRTAVQEQIILPLRAQNYATLVPGQKERAHGLHDGEVHHPR